MGRHRMHTLPMDILGMVCMFDIRYHLMGRHRMHIWPMDILGMDGTSAPDKYQSHRSYMGPVVHYCKYRIAEVEDNWLLSGMEYISVEDIRWDHLMEW